MKLDPQTQKEAAAKAPVIKSAEASAKKTILQRWDLTAEELTQIVDENPSMRGLMLGYVAEYKLRKECFSDQRCVDVRKKDDHDRSSKGDLRFRYRGYEFKIECKSLQTNSIIKEGEGEFRGRYQCDASDRRAVEFPNGTTLETTCLLVGEFDLVAVNLYAFENQWRFAFALNKDLPRSQFQKYTGYQRRYLLASLMPITWPLELPYVADPFALLDRIVDDPSLQRKRASTLRLLSGRPKNKSDSSARGAGP